jgi:type III secretory pathway component EscS
MDYTNLVKFVPEQLLILVAALGVVGYFVKSTNKIQDAYIPFILMVLGVAGSLLMMGLNVTSVLQGIISAAVAVLGNNIVKQGSEILGTTDTTDVK